ncbi:MAG: NFACT family protein [Erysipelotrichaceae bacterium]|nr:NFACT family protein [Erysipelotrichaceae bacterium]
MAFDGIFLRQIVKQLQVLENSHINKIYQISDTEILFNLYAQKKYQLMVSCHSSYNRIHLTERNYPTRNNPSNFIMIMRKYLEGGTITSIKQAGLDRYLTISVANRNEIGDRITLDIYVELMGKYANLILVSDNKIIDALKRIPPFENTKRTIHPGARFKVTESQSGKIDPFTIDEVNDSDNLFEKLVGFSPLLSDEVRYRLNNGQSYKEILHEIDSSDRVYISSNDMFHCIPLTHLKKPYVSYPICEGLDEIYFSKEEKERIRQQTGDLFKFTRREIKKIETKIQRLEDSLEEARNCDIWRQYGDALYANMDKVVKGMTTVTLTDYSGNELTIPLDVKLDVKGNARKCFQKYRKGSTGQKYIVEQLEVARENLSYFNLIQQQLEQADFRTAREIRQELEKNGYIRRKKVRAPKKKQSEPQYLKIPFNDKFIYVGKNNIQNDYITFRKAGRVDTWFHVKDIHGAHVVITTSHPTEEEIRLCAQLAAWYSKARESSSIPVNYTLIKHIKKIPGSKLGLVSMSEYNTIYIDINEEYLRNFVTF